MLKGNVAVHFKMEDKSWLQKILFALLRFAKEVLKTRLKKSEPKCFSTLWDKWRIVAKTYSGVKSAESFPAIVVIFLTMAFLY